MMPVVACEDIKLILRQEAEQIDEALRTTLARYQGTSPRLAEAMRYSLDAGGKRVRPALVLWCCDLCRGDRQVAVPAAVAVECVHTFSLIHDDLPALDDDDVRRGRPANHKKFGEALAILAGDGLLALSFELLARQVLDPALAVAMVRELASAAGWQGMIGGEAADIEGESVPPDARLVARIHAAKTARLIEASCRLGAMAARADDGSVAALGKYGYELGLAFQVTDDLLDVSTSSGQMGKPTGKDDAAGKQTYLRAVGVEESRSIATAAADRAMAALAPFDPKAARLRSLAQFVVNRRC
ncbi:MAG: polyprenyl synthetase family protein [Phycisphaerae bacterium]|nr:polyprenyl synthetase family protein [Phycisphaerae bacterium]